VRVRGLAAKRFRFAARDFSCLAPPIEHFWMGPTRSSACSRADSRGQTCGCGGTLRIDAHAGRRRSCERCVRTDWWNSSVTRWRSEPWLCSRPWPLETCDHTESAYIFDRSCVPTRRDPYRLVAAARAPRTLGFRASCRPPRAAGATVGSFLCRIGRRRFGFLTPAVISTSWADVVYHRPDSSNPGNSGCRISDCLPPAIFWRST
jgi:hypothetical protein